MSPWRIISLWVPVAVFILLLSVASGRSDPPEVPVWDKLMHVAAYGVLGVLAMRAFHGGAGRLRWGASLAAVALTVGYGAIDEVHQSFVPGRDPSGWDVMADFVGAMAAVGVMGTLSGLRLLHDRRRGSENA